jgi:formamidopyrimidine-DNA glycosylase
VSRLRSRLHAIVRLAVAVGADDRRYPRTWLFHDRWGRKAGARTARGEPILHVTIGGRTTAVVTARKARRAPSGRSLKRAAGR